jgi:hypothetical protein
VRRARLQSLRNASGEPAQRTHHTRNNHPFGRGTVLLRISERRCSQAWRRRTSAVPNRLLVVNRMRLAAERAAHRQTEGANGHQGMCFATERDQSARVVYGGQRVKETARTVLFLIEFDSSLPPFFQETRCSEKRSTFAQYRNQPRSASLYIAVYRLVAPSTKGDQVLFRIIPKITSPPQVMDIEIRHRSAALTAPSVALQDFQAELFVLLRIHTNCWAPSPRRPRAHGSARPAIGDASSPCTCTGVFSISFTSREAPARKSAQIISRQ